MLKRGEAVSADNDKRELLKLKQGLIEQSDSIDEGGYDAVMPQTAGEKIKNWLWYKKGIIGIGVVLIIVVLVVFYFFFVLEKPDITVYSAGNYNTTMRQLLENNMKNYYTDANNDGRVKISINQAGNDPVLGYTDLYNELDSGKAQVYIGTKDKLTSIYEDYQKAENREIFADLSEFTSVPDEYLINIKDTEFGKRYKILSTDIFFAVKNTDDDNEQMGKDFVGNLYYGKIFNTEQKGN